MLADDLLDQRVRRSPRAASWTSRHSGRSRRRRPADRSARRSASGRLDVGRRSRSGAIPDLLQRDVEEAVLVQVADEVARDLAHAVADARHVELPDQVLVEVVRAREDVLERVLLGLLLVLARVVRRVEVVLEVGVEVDLLERVALLLGGGRRPPRAALASSLSRAASTRSVSVVSSCSSRTGFSTTSCVSTSCSSRRDICRSLIACCSDGVITSRWESRRLSFCSSAMGDGCGSAVEPETFSQGRSFSPQRRSRVQEACLLSRSHRR